jgi:hypothetical protein
MKEHRLNTRLPRDISSWLQHRMLAIRFQRDFFFAAAGSERLRGRRDRLRPLLQRRVIEPEPLSPRVN